MNVETLNRLLRGPFAFLRPEPDLLRRLKISEEAMLPLPQRIFFEDEWATPALGFPVLQSKRTRALREAVAAYVGEEEALELSVLRGRPPDRRAAEATWSYYARLLQAALDNAISSSFGRHYPSILWLYHSIAVSRLFKESPNRLRRLDLALGRASGDEVKYRVFHRYLRRVLDLTYEVVGRVAARTEEAELDLFPAVLERMRDNVLILTEDHVSRDLRELESYFRGQLRIDGRLFRARLAALDEWHADLLHRDERLADAARRLLGAGEALDPWRLLTHGSWVPFLAGHREYDPERLLPPEWVEVWDRLLVKLQEFELLASVRRYAVPIRREDDGRLVCSAAAVGRALSGPAEIGLSSSTRPLDFGTPWVVDPVVQRFGLIYDITDFSQVVSEVRRSSSSTQDETYRGIFGFQRRVNRMAGGFRLRLEKYLGDGAFYSSRYPHRAVAAAVHLQRAYRRALADGFPFDRGLRIALNYGSYRLLPIEGGAGGDDHRYEFFGHGIVELSRLVTGKTTREIEDIKTLLVSRGYDPARVEEFFAPMARQQVYVADRAEEARPFFAYIRSGGALVNEGMVATAAFLRALDEWGGYSVLCAARDGARAYVAAEIEDEGGSVLVGFRKLGLARLKGLGEIVVYELVDGGDWPSSALLPLDQTRVLDALDKQPTAVPPVPDAKL